MISRDALKEIPRLQKMGDKGISIDFITEYEEIQIFVEKAWQATPIELIHVMEEENE